MNEWTEVWLVDDDADDDAIKNDKIAGCAGQKVKEEESTCSVLMLSGN